MYRTGVSALIKNNKEEFLLVNLHSFEEKYFCGFEFLEGNINIPDNEVRNYKWVKFEDLYKYLLFDGQLEDTIGKIKKIFKKK